jgi:uncharacterized protein DUF6541
VSGILLYVRLALATAVVLAPGWAIARALGVRGAAASLAWGLAAIFGALTVTFVVSGSLTLTLVLLLLAGAAALPGARRRPRRRGVLPGAPVAAALGVLLGILLWHVAGEVGGDGLFHLARVRKLVDLGDLSLDSLNEFPDGGLHPGYAFPLWHGFVALVAKVSGADPTDVVRHLPSILAPFAVLVWLEAGWSLFRRAAPAAVTAAAAVALVAMSPGHGGAYTALALPATASRQLLVPAALALALAAVRRPSKRLLGTTAVAGLALAVVHPTYAVFLCIPFAGFVAVRALWTRSDVRAGLLALGALSIPTAAFIVWLQPIASSAASTSPGVEERLRAFRLYEGQLDVRSIDSFSVVPDVFGRAGLVAVAGLLLAPLAGLAARRRWAAFVVGGGLAVALITLVPFLFVPFSDVVSISQGRRLVGFFPFPFAVAGGMGVLAALAGPLVAPIALAAGIVLQLVYPGDFAYRLTEGGPAWATWLAVTGMCAALVVGLRRRPPLEARAALASALLLAPAYVHGLGNWSTSGARPASQLSPALVEALRDEVPTGATVYADPEASYRIAAFAPVRICVAPPGHVADTTENRPRERVQEFRRFARTGNLALPRACGARWLVVDRSRFDLQPDLPVVFRDARWTLYRLGGAP